MVRPTPAIQAIPATTPFVGPEQLMRERGLSELVRLGANESPFGPSPRAIAAMESELPRLGWYGDPESLELRDALAAKHACDPEQIVIGSGIDDVMGLAVRAFVPPGTAVLTTRGTYPTLNYHAIGYGATLAYADYRDDGTVDLDGLSAAARRTRPALVYLANPDNPSGSFADAAGVAGLLEALPEDCLLLLDEAYADFVDDRDLMPARFDGRLVRMRTFSKAYGMAGARIGYGLTSADNVRTFQKFVCTTESTATLKSGRWRRCATTRFGITSSPKRRRRGRRTTNSPASLAADTLRRTPTSFAWIWRRPSAPSAWSTSCSNAGSGFASPGRRRSIVTFA